MKPRIFLAALLLLILRAAAAQSPAPPYSIAGTVVDAVTGNPIPHAELTLQLKNDQSTATAGGSGKFLFDHLEAGKYQLYARAPGYSSQGLDQHGSYFTGVVVAGGIDSQHIVFRLHPQAVIFGKVTDERGEAVRNATVLVVSQSKDSPGRRPAAWLQTNDLGEYRSAGLLPGKYFVAVSARPWYAQTGFLYVPEQSDDQRNFGFHRIGQAKPDPALDVVYPLTFYPGVTDEGSSTELNLREGESQQADIPLRAVPALHLRLTNLPPDQTASPRIGARQRPFGALSIGASMQIAQIAPGEVEIAGLPPGDLTLYLAPPDGNDRNAPQLDVTVSGEATIDASKTLPAAAISGSIVTQDPGAVPQAGLIRLMGISRDAFASIKKDGTFVFPRVPLGTFQVLVNLASPATYIQKIAASGANTIGHRLIITTPGDVQLTIVTGSGPGQVTGTATRNGRPLDGVLVLLLPESAEEIASEVRVDQSNSDGSFLLANITPGKYWLLAIRDGWDLDYRNPAVIKPYLGKAQALQIAPNDVRKLTVDVQPLLK